MNIKIEKVLSKIKQSWNLMEIRDIRELQRLLSELAIDGLANFPDSLDQGLELYRDTEIGFVLTAYSEVRDTYRIPHNHGRGWVIYAVAQGAVQMGDYFKWEQSEVKSRLIFKEKSILRDGEVKIYFPGEIHDTRCLSEKAIILRLTSCDLKVEEKEGRMLRFDPIKKSCSI